jgi:general secretion pathway protein E
LRQDPDVILVGEIRDKETASVASQAALTGHLVFSSLHANGSVGAVIRLRDLGLDDFLIASTLRGVIAQRLLRKLCPECCDARPITDAEIQQFVSQKITPPKQTHHAIGCTACGGSGFAGRIGIFEIVEVGGKLREAIDAGASEHQLKAVALSSDLTLLGQGLAAVAKGETTMAETVRVVGDVV